MVRSCITFAGTRVDQLVAIDVLEALRLLGVLSSFRIKPTIHSQLRSKDN